MQIKIFIAYVELRFFHGLQKKYLYSGIEHEAVFGEIMDLKSSIVYCLTTYCLFFRVVLSSWMFNRLFIMDVLFTLSGFIIQNMYRVRIHNPLKHYFLMNFTKYVK